LHAPLLGRRVPAGETIGQRAGLGAKRRDGHRQQVGDLEGREHGCPGAHMPTGRPAWPRIVAASPRCIALCAMTAAPRRVARLMLCHAFSTHAAFGPKAPAFAARAVSAGAMISSHTVSGSSVTMSRVRRPTALR